MSTGKPITKEERQTRSLKHLINTLKMGVRRDIGGQRPIEEHHEIIGQKFAGKTVLQAGKIAADMLEKQRNGIAERLQHTIDELTERIHQLEKLAATFHNTELNNLVKGKEANKTH